MSVTSSATKSFSYNNNNNNDKINMETEDSAPDLSQWANFYKLPMSL